MWIFVVCWEGGGGGGGLLNTYMYHIHDTVYFYLSLAKGVVGLHVILQWSEFQIKHWRLGGI